MPQSAQAIAPTLAVIDGIATTTSVDVAVHFGKQHMHVMERIRATMAETPAKFNESNFRLVDYTDAKGEQRPAYRLTRDGFTLLAMGFTGKKALAFKLAYIEAFNQMEAALRAPVQVGAVATLQQLTEAVSALTVHVAALPRSMVPALPAPAQSPEYMRVRRQHIIDLWTDLGRLRARYHCFAQLEAELGLLRERVGSFGQLESDLPPSWWQSKRIAKNPWEVS